MLLVNGNHARKEMKLYKRGTVSLKKEIRKDGGGSDHKGSPRKPNNLKEACPKRAKTIFKRGGQGRSGKKKLQ